MVGWRRLWLDLAWAGWPGLGGLVWLTRWLADPSWLAARAWPAGSAGRIHSTIIPQPFHNHSTIIPQSFCGWLAGWLAGAA